MATDIAFSLGVASLLGKRVPLSLKIFLTALAIIDDLGAIVAIALFYTGTLHPFWLLTGLAVWIVLVIWNQRKLPFGVWNFIAGLFLWFCMYNSGIHATIAGSVKAVHVSKGDRVTPGEVLIEIE
jgi:NhaA family Na+:H+ antiporter